jgi:hypothetical protein
MRTEGEWGEDVIRQVRLGTALYALFGTLLLLEAVWVDLGKSGLASARDWADVHGPHGVPVLLLGGMCVIAVAWSILRGHRWAWLVAVISAGVWAVAGIPALGLLLVLPQGAAWAREHPMEPGLGLISVTCLASSLITLSRREVRNQFRRGNEAGGRAAKGTRVA